MTHLVIDGDLLAFKATAANEERSIIAKNSITGEERSLRLRTDLKDEVGKEEYVNWQIEDVQSPKNFKFSCNTAESMINKWISFANASSYEIVLTGSNNFRDEIPLPRKYKSNRSSALRPLHLKKMRNWLVEKYGASVTDGYECDDKLAMLSYGGLKSGEKIIQCSIDKDSFGYDGWILHMDCIEPPIHISGFGKLTLIEKPKTKELKGYGKIWMLTQSVLGDDSDGYKPCELSGKKFGDVACYNLLKDCKDVKEALQAIYNQYKTWYPEPITYIAWDGEEYTKSAVEIWDMYFACARMLRYEEDFVSIQSVLNFYEIAYD